jgi:hypothetical protein
MIRDRKLPRDLERLMQADLSKWITETPTRDDYMGLAREMWMAGRASKIASEQVAPEANHEASRCSD